MSKDELDATQPTVYSQFGNETDAKRDRWPNRTAFYLAAVGSAVGFGNVWRFPSLAKDYGGGAFFVPYIMALFLVGLPILLLEISLGQVHQVGNVGGYGWMHARLRGVGVAGVFCAFILVVYYSMLLTWVARAFFESFGPEDPWADDGVTGQQAVDYFIQDIIGQRTVDEGNQLPTRMVGINVGYTVLVWISVYLCLAFGSKITGTVVYFTMGLPILFLFLFLFKSITLDGASDGIEAYIGKWDMNVLVDQSDCWSTAVSQIFFSVGVTFGTMSAYGSQCPQGEPATMNTCVIGISNCMFSFIAGFAVFAALGHLAYLEGGTVDDVPYAGFSLVFGTWPVVFGTFKGGEHWVRLLFLDLYLLGIDSAFSILEAPICIVTDAIEKKGLDIPRYQVCMVFCIIAFLASLLFATDAGLFYLDAVDFYINFMFLLIGFLETFSAGWIYGIEDQLKSLGGPVVWTYMATNFLSVIIACGVWFGAESVWGGFVALFLSFGAGCVATVVLMLPRIGAQDGPGTLSEGLYILCAKNVVDLTDFLSSYVGYIPTVWTFLIKQFIPHVLLLLFINLCQSDNGNGKPQFGYVYDLPTWPYQVIGISTTVIAFLIFFIGTVLPNLYEPFDLTTLVASSKEVEPPIKAIEDEAEADSVEA